MKKLDKTKILGLGKTLFNSSLCLIDTEQGRDSIELILSERLTRKKADGAWPSLALNSILKKRDQENFFLSENRDVTTPLEFEERLNRAGPFYESLKRQGLEQFSRAFNPEIENLTHHLCHAYAALGMSPFEKAIIVVIDGAGSRVDERFHEACSVYLQDEKKLTLVESELQEFYQSQKYPKHWFSTGLGTLYEKAAEFIFNSKRASGKVMGLAAFGEAEHFTDRKAYLENLNWDLAFQGKSKKDWEESGRFQLFANVAASVQKHFEESLLKLTTRLKEIYPEYENLILTGGCALNCTTNMKIVQTNLFKKIYTPPFPGDECIGFGAAFWSYYNKCHAPWSVLPFEKQQGYFGPKASEPTEEKIKNVFHDYELVRPESITQYCAKVLNEGHILAWFQGRSESGPRALGHRSLLSKVNREGLKDYLNAQVKFREAFRPYGCSLPHDDADRYFEIPKGFDNPYMSFAVFVRPEWKEEFKEVTHLDGTSRMQTVRVGQCPRYYELLKEFGKISGLPCVLNTSLNVMGEPIVESVEDAKHFLENAEVYGLAIGDYFIKKKR